MLKETLCQIGFTRNEAKIYIVLVELGPQPANVIARRSGLQRTTVYPIIKGLEKKSLVSSFIKNGIKFFGANDLNNLLDYVERKRRLLDHHRDFVLDIMPRMEQLKSSMSVPPKVHYYEGANGVETVMTDSLRSNGQILCITNTEKWLNSDLQLFIKDYINTRIFKKKIQLKGLAKDTEKARCFLKDCYGDSREASQYTDMRFIKGGEYLFDNVMKIYDNKVGIVYPERGCEFGVLIESEEFARTQRSIFDLAWKGALIHNKENENKG